MRTHFLSTAKGGRPRQRGVILLLACFSMPVLISLMGLGIDVGLIYAVKARLQMACDGAAVAALRSLSLAQTTAAQTTAATNIAQQWFTANFAGNYLGATGTSSPTITVVDDNTNRIRTVTVTATTTSPTYFMKLWGRNGTSVGATGQAARRDVVIMLVLDRSGSMNNSNNNYGGQSPCQVMVSAAKQFTGMFQQGRDRIGLVSFAGSVQVTQTPTTSFQTALGYTNSNGSQTGALDNISCGGGTNTAAGVSLAWNEIYKTKLPGALNAIVLFTDGQPTAGIFPYVVPASVDPSGSAQSVVSSNSYCQDSAGVALRSGGNFVTKPRNWLVNQANSGSAVSFGTGSYYSALQGPIGGLYGDGGGLYGVWPFYSPTGTSVSAMENTVLSTTEAPGCGFPTNYYNLGDPTTDIAFVPPQDIFGNSSTGYVTSLSTSLIQGAYRIKVNTSNVNNVTMNLADSAGNWARGTHSYSDGTTMPGTMIYTIGLGGNGGVDFTLLQRMANDPNADPHGAYPAYPGYNTAQPVGTFIYSADASGLQAAFVRLASMILRISK